MLFEIITGVALKIKVVKLFFLYNDICSLIFKNFFKTKIKNSNKYVPNQATPISKIVTTYVSTISG